MAEAVSDAPLRETPLAATHRALGARMVPFAGYSMPVQYPAGIIAEHKWTREHAGLFDVSHMGPSFLSLTEKSGDTEKDHAAVAALIEPLITADVRGLKPGQVRYTLLLNGEGGIVDDLMVARPRDPAWSGTLYVVVNAGTKDGDFARIAKAAGVRATLTRSDDGALLALQGPEAAAVIRDIAPEAAELGFMTYGSFPFEGTRLLISRSGYTGEDGFEILAGSDHAVSLWQRLTADPRVKPIGLGARDSLRLEAGLPLYGHDLDETTTPTEANLGFAISKRRREARDFPSAGRILTESPRRLRVGLLVEGAPAREGADIADANGAKVGTVTSGGFAPTLNRPIAMGYVDPMHAAPGTSLNVVVRGRAQPATVVALPFVPHRYFRKGSP
ncbi:MAG TPA: glycine cleavage system aminomethyltransferase GcvT [Bauldia sp.]|nr:glycine cleavage system aminomethyltransferase GcvT [Bauldia sp.]